MLTCRLSIVLRVQYSAEHLVFETLNQPENNAKNVDIAFIKGTTSASRDL